MVQLHDSSDSHAGNYSHGEHNSRASLVSLEIRGEHVLLMELKIAQDQRAGPPPKTQQLQLLDPHFREMDALQIRKKKVGTTSNES